MTFSDDDLALIDETLLVEIETRASDGPIHLTTIWARRSRMVRSGFGRFGAHKRWYSEALADPQVALHVAGRRLPVCAVPAADPASIRAC